MTGETDPPDIGAPRRGTRAERSRVYLVPIDARAPSTDRDAGPDRVPASRVDDPPDLLLAEAAAARDVQDPDALPEREDWAWVQEWRAGAEPAPWATGLTLTLFSALIVGVAVWVLSAGLADRPVVAVAVNLLVAGGLAPAMWLSRELPVLRWIGAGALIGVVVGWACALLMLPLPAP
jgi:hypothetical protein